MSYCRWSSDNWRSDVYVYEHCDGGWTTHVAGRKRVGDRPDDPWSWEWIQKLSTKNEQGQTDPAVLVEWNSAKALHDAWMETAPWHPVPEPWGGQSYSDPTPQDCAARLRQMKADGIHVPDGVIEELEGETVVD